jgi:general secretion pathway protein E
MATASDAIYISLAERLQPVDAPQASGLDQHLADDVSILDVGQPDLGLTPFSIIQEHRVAALRVDDRPGPRFVAADDASFGASFWIVRRLGAQAAREGVWIPSHDFSLLVARWERDHSALGPSARSAEETLAQSSDDGREALSLGSIESTADPTVRFINATLLDALNAGASDVHLEATPAGLAVKFRLDGVLVPVTRAAGVDTAERAISRVKVMSELDISERRVPQDGRLKLQAGGRDIDVRVSIMPSIHGEDAVLRILDRQALVTQMRALTIRGLGFDDGLAQELLPLFKLPYGMVLITGPTGSGKTTTLYAAISETRDPREKIVTIEDPVEYQLDGVLQIPVNERKGLSFASGLRSILRHDPDRILVGEIRDAETARIAVQAALTGHLVMTTIHANNALDVLSRFKQFGIDPYDVVTALVGVVAQRLLRKLCPECSEPESEDAIQHTASALGSRVPGAERLRVAVGCTACRCTGYRGRMAVGELVVFDKRLRRAVIASGNLALADEAELIPGVARLHDKALLAAWGGHTSLAEVARATAVQ